MITENNGFLWDEEDETPFGTPFMTLPEKNSETKTVDIEQEECAPPSSDTSEPTETAEPTESTPEANYILREGMIVNRMTGEAYADAIVDVLCLSKRAYNCLRRSGYNMISDAALATESDLIEIRNMGRNTLLEVKEKVRLYLTSSNKSDVIIPAEKAVNETEEKRDPGYDYIHSPVSELKLSARARNALLRNGINELGQLLECDEEKIIDFVNVGIKTLNEIIELKNNAYEKYGLPTLEAVTPSSVFNDSETFAEKFITEFSRYTISDSVIKTIKTIVIGLYLSNNDITYENVYRDVRIKSRLLNAFITHMKTNYPCGAEENAVRQFFSESVPSDIIEGIFEETTETTSHGELILKSADWETVLMENFPDKHERDIAMIHRRLRGATLEEIAQDLGLTKERIRQIIHKTIRKVTAFSSKNKISIRQNRFLPILSKYRMTRAMFLAITEEPSLNYEFMKLANDFSDAPDLPEMMLDDSVIPDWIKSNLCEYLDRETRKDFLYVNDEHGHRRLLPKKRSDVIKYVLSAFCRKQTSIEDFWGYYNKFLAEHGEDYNEELIVDSNNKRSQENALYKTTYRYALCSYHGVIRYYHIDSRDYSELYETLQLDSYRDVEISTLLFFRKYPELMRKYDICDEYELHNLLKKTDLGDGNPYVTWKSMPYILFGTFERDRMVKETMSALAPISSDELAEYISIEYGFKVQSVSGWFSVIKEYYHDGIYSIDYEDMSEEEMQLLSDRLTEPFYELKDIKRIYKELFPESDASLVSSYNLKRMGFVVNSTYAVRGYSSASRYFEAVFTERDITDITPYKKDIFTIGVFSQTLYRLKENYTIIEFEPDQYIHIRRLNRMGITADDLRAYCDHVSECTEENELFTVASLKNDGFTDKLDQLGFADWFYASVLFEDSRFSHSKIGGNILFCKGEMDVSAASLAETMMADMDAVYIDDFMEDVEARYGIRLDKERLIHSLEDTELYYNPTMQRIYVNYDAYYEELKYEED